MVNDEPSVVSEGTTVQNEFLQQAVTALRTRYESGGTFGELSPAAAADLGDTLFALATSSTADAIDREEAIALAHRIVDDDHPELSPLWPEQAE